VVRGSKLQTYTAGVVWRQGSARYAERIHHPDRLLYIRLPPHRAEGVGASSRGFPGDEALDEIAARFDAAEREFRRAVRSGPYYLWPVTMGLVMRGRHQSPFPT